MQSVWQIFYTKWGNYYEMTTVINDGYLQMSEVNIATQ